MCSILTGTEITVSKKLCVFIFTCFSAGRSIRQKPQKQSLNLKCLMVSMSAFSLWCKLLLWFMRLCYLSLYFAFCYRISVGMSQTRSLHQIIREHGVFICVTSGLCRCFLVLNSFVCMMNVVVRLALISVLF